MTGFAGVYDADAGGDDLRRVVDRMCAHPIVAAPALGVAGADIARCSVAGREGVALGRGMWLAFDGELYNRAELEAHLRSYGEAAADGDAALCLALLAREGDAFVERLNGQFNIAIYRAAGARLSIATDRAGYRPLFVTRRGSRTLFATSLKAILAGLDGAPEIDGIGLLLAMRGGWTLGSRTWLDGIAVADPGTWLHLDRDGCRRQRYFRLRFATSKFRDVGEYTEGLAACLERAVGRATLDGRRFGLPLSGGLDSRSLLLATTRGRRPSLTYTFGHPWSYDVVYARRLAEIAGVRHRLFAYDPGYLGRALERIVWLTEGMTGFAHSAFTSICFHDHIAEEVDVLLYGHAGDNLTGAHLRPWVAAQRSVSRLIERTFRQYNLAPEPILQRVFNESFYRRHAGGLFDAMRESFAGIEGDCVADVADVWDMENRQRRGTFSSGALDRSRFAVRAPFLDNDVVDHLRHAPLRWRILQTAYKRMIVERFRDSAGVPWAHTGRRLQPTLLGDFVQESWNYAAQRLRRPAVDPRQFRDLALDTRADAALARALTEFIEHPQFPGDVFDRGGIEDVVNRHWVRQDELTHLVIMLATFATAWRLLLYESPRTALASTG